MFGIPMVSFLQLWDLASRKIVGETFEEPLVFRQQARHHATFWGRGLGETSSSTSENFGGIFGRRRLGAGQTHHCLGSEAIQFFSI